MNDHVTTLRQISEMYRGTATSQTLREAADALATLEATILRLRQMEGDVQHLRHELLTARRPLEVEISRLKQQKDDAYARGKLEGWNAGRADGEVAEKVLAGKLADAQARIDRLEALNWQPIDMILHCPACLEQHIDAATETWPNEPHRSHLCKHCGFIWRPSDVATNGVAEIKTKGKDDMVLIDGPLEVMRQIRMRDAAQPKLDWDGERP